MRDNHADPSNAHAASPLAARPSGVTGASVAAGSGANGWSGRNLRAADLPTQLSRQLSETAPVIRSALERLHGRPVLIVTPENAAVTNGRLVLSESNEASPLPTLAVEFTLRGLVFSMEIPLGRVFEIVGSWNGTHFVCRLSSDRLRIAPPGR